MTVVACTEFPEPKNLKEILELLHKIGDSVHAKRNVGQKLLKDVETYCKDAQKFYQSGSGSEVLSTVFTNANGIRGSILKNSGTQYDKYKDLETEHGSHERCVAEALKKCLPKAYAALLFMLFNCDSEFSGYSLGAWSGQKVNDSGVSSQDLFNWLTKEKSVGGGSSKPLTPGLIKRGFSDRELKNSNKGQNVATVIKTIIKHDSAGPLQNVLASLLFSCPWDDSLLGHALCFLYTFCSKVSQGSESLLQKPYKEHSEAFKEVCQGLKDSLEPFIGGSSGLSAVCHQNQKLFDSLWDESKFEAYCTWLKRNVYRIIGALVSMSQDCPDWDLFTLQSASSAGPFKYGFVFTDSSWTSGSTSKSKLQGYISKLTESDSGSLQKFISFLFNPSTPSSAGATAGGVVTGLLGLGGAGAGAAYATNAFGFQNLITSLISSFLK